MSLFQQCAVASDGNESLILQCVADSLEKQAELESADSDQWFLVLAGALVSVGVELFVESLRIGESLIRGHIQKDD